MKYDVNYFINKFEAIPDDKWCIGILDNLQGAHCVLGHCGVTAGSVMYNYTEEARGLVSIMVTDPILVNDSEGVWPGKTPKERILQLLKTRV